MLVLYNLNFWFAAEKKQKTTKTGSSNFNTATQLSILEEPPQRNTIDNYLKQSSRSGEATSVTVNAQIHQQLLDITCPPSPKSNEIHSSGNSGSKENLSDVDGENQWDDDNLNNSSSEFLNKSIFDDDEVDEDHNSISSNAPNESDSDSVSSNPSLKLDSEGN